MRLFVRAAGWERGYYWSEVSAGGVRDVGQVPVEQYFELLRNQDSLAPSLSVYHSAAGYHVLCLGLATRRNEPTRRVITNSLLLESTDEKTARLFTASILAGDDAAVFRTHFEQELDHCIDHDDTQHHYRIGPELHGIVSTWIATAAEAGEPDPFPDDVFVERLFASNNPERRRELHAALCRYELPPSPPENRPRLLLAVTGIEDAKSLCEVGAWIALSDRCDAEGWQIFTPAGQTRSALWDKC
jgi:hypothetical protein